MGAFRGPWRRWGSPQPTGSPESMGSPEPLVPPRPMEPLPPIGVGDHAVAAALGVAARRRA